MVLDLLIPKSLGEAVALWVTEKGIHQCSKRTIDFYRYNMRPFLERFDAESEVHAISPDQVREFFALESQRLRGKAHTLHAEYRTVRAFFSWAQANRYVLENPVQLPAPQLPQRVKPIIEPQDFACILRHCDNTVIGRRDRAILMLFYDTGIRLQEMADLKLADIDIAESRITVHGKGNKYRVVPLSENVLAAVWEWLKVRQSILPALWLGEEGQPLTASGIQQAVKRVTRRALGKPLGTHIFRHSFSCLFLEAGGDSFDLQTLLGHSSLRTTQGYSEATKVRRALKAHERYSPVGRLDWGKR